MAILNLGLTGSTYTQSSSNGYRVYESADSSVGSAGHDIYLTWSTEYGGAVQDSFTFTFYWRGWSKGTSGVSAWSSPITVTVDANLVTRRQPYSGGRTWWYYPITSLAFISEAFPDGIRYDTRAYDQIDVQVSLYSNYTNSAGVKRKSDTVRANVYVGHVPEYSITSVYYEESDLVVIEYDTTWERQDDRYCFEEAYVTDYGAVSDDPYFSDIIQIVDDTILKTRVWGTITAPGRIEVPTSILNQHIKNRVLYLDIRFNAAYRPADMDFANARGYFEVEDRTICNTPTLRLTSSNDPYSVSVVTGDSGDLDAPIEKVTVKLLGGQYGADEVTVTPGDTATLRFCPFGQPLCIEAVGSRSKATSASVSVWAPAIVVTRGITVLDSIAANSRAILEYNQTFDIKTTGEKEIVKLARRRPSAFYGTGGSTSVRMQTVLVDESGLGIERMPELGDVMMRIHDGRRYALAAEVSLSWEGPRIKNVTISGEEVSA